MFLSKPNWVLRFARPRVRWLALMVARAAVMLAMVGAVVFLWEWGAPAALVAFVICVLAILFLEAAACDRRRSRSGSAAAGVSRRRRRETDF